MNKPREVQPAEALERVPESRTPVRLRPSVAAEVLAGDAAGRAHKEIGPHKNGETLENKVRGRCGEILAHEARPSSVDLNQIAHMNFPVYDLADPEHMMSVKTRVNRRNGTMPLDNYVHDLRYAIGATTPAERGRYAGMTGPDVAAQQLMEVKNADPARWESLRGRLPTNIWVATSDHQMAQAMKDSALVLIPADHVRAARAHLWRRIMTDPAEFGLPSSPRPQELRRCADELVARIQPIRRNLSSSVIDAQAQRTLRRRIRS